MKARSGDIMFRRSDGSVILMFDVEAASETGVLCELDALDPHHDRFLLCCRRCRLFKTGRLENDAVREERRVWELKDCEDCFVSLVGLVDSCHSPAVILRLRDGVYCFALSSKPVSGSYEMPSD